MTFTPGPWEAVDKPGAGWEVRKKHERPGYKGLAPICAMSWWQFDIPGIIDNDIAEANAILIAAAPELLEACRLAYRSARVVHGEDSELCVKLNAVIAKAEGRS